MISTIENMLPKPMTADENRHYLRAFIHTYRDRQCLWDTSLRDYTNRDKRAEAYEQLVPIYRYLKRDATVEDVKKKINTLRTNYRKELKVVECARRSGNVHQPRCWTYHELDFLRNTEKFLAVHPHSRSESAFAFNENSQTQASFMDAPSPYTFRPLLSSSAHSQHSVTPNVAEMFQKSFGHTQKLEQMQQTPGTTTTTTPHTSTTDYSHEMSSAVKRQRDESQTPDEMLTMACDYLSSTFPEEESIARTWTYKLKRMQREQRLFAEKFINEILFEGESGTLHRGSVHVNTFEPFVRLEEQQPQHSDTKSQSPSVHVSTSTLAHDPEAKELHAAATKTTGNGSDFSTYS